MSNVSKIIRERAMAILRETRAKIDPALLAAMKEHISAAMPAPETLKKPEPSAAGEKKFIPPVLEEILPAQPASREEAVDKQKVAQIVLNYMKHKENGSRH